MAMKRIYGVQVSLFGRKQQQFVGMASWIVVARNKSQDWQG
jgi:hypothetical protein